MALGREVVEAPSPDALAAEKHSSGAPGYDSFRNPYDGDVEDPVGRKMSRIDKAWAKPTGAGDNSDSDSNSGMSVGKQMEMEAGNAIKYRTCSWPKV